jgi:hypothetical protein
VKPAVRRGAGVGGLGFLEVVVVVAGVGGEPAAVHMQDCLRERADEIHVVADEEQRALVVLEGVDERVDRGDVEVRRRLVHQQQVGRVDEEAGEREAGLLAAGEDGGLCEDVVLAEEEGAEHGAGLLLGELVLVRAQLHHVLENGEVEFHVVAAVLREVAGDDVAAELRSPPWIGMTSARILSSVDLPAPLGPTSTMLLAALHGEVEVLVNDMVPVGLLHVLELMTFRPERGGCGKLEVDLLEILPRLLDGDLLEALDLLFLGLGARGHRGLGAEAVHEFLEVGDLALLVLEGAACCSLRASFSVRKLS